MTTTDPRSAFPMRAARALLAPALALILASAWPPAKAEAHAILVASTPPIAGSVPAGHVAITLRYNSRIDRGRSRLTLLGPEAGVPAVLPIGEGGPPDVMTTAADLRPGRYTIRWQVLAVDGHITRGDVPFTATAATAQLGTDRAGTETMGAGKAGR